MKSKYTFYQLNFTKNLNRLNELQQEIIDVLSDGGEIVFSEAIAEGHLVILIRSE